MVQHNQTFAVRSQKLTRGEIATSLNNCLNDPIIRSELLSQGFERKDLVLFAVNDKRLTDDCCRTLVTEIVDLIFPLMDAEHYYGESARDCINLGIKDVKINCLCAIFVTTILAQNEAIVCLSHPNLFVRQGARAIIRREKKSKRRLMR